ncbi:MAG: hypothetical protein WCP55_17955, partial [Lentisphaerota bacterium]
EFNGGVYHVYPWANKYEEWMRRDIPLLAEEIGLPAMGHDLYMEWPTAPLYRGPLDHYMEGWSFDANGKCLTALLGLREIVKFTHSVTNSSGHTVGFFANGLVGVSPLTMASPDAWMSESQDLHSLVDEPGFYGIEGRYNYKLARNFSGSKPVIHHSYAFTKLGDVITWDKLDAQKLVEVIDDFYKDMVTFYYQAGQLPSSSTMSALDSVYDEAPYIFDVLSRGWSPSPIIAGDDKLERARYGEGLQSAVVITSLERKAVTSHETVINDYLGDFYAVPMNLKGQSQNFEFADRLTKFDLNVEPMDNLIFTLNAALKLSDNTRIAGRSETQISPVAKNYRLTLQVNQSGQAKLLATPDPRFVIKSITCNNAPVTGEDIKLQKGENVIEIKTRSTEFLSTLEEYAAFPFDKADIVLAGTTSKRLEAAGQNLQDFLTVRLKTTPVILKQRNADRANVVIGTVAELKKTGVWVDGNTLFISGKNDFDTQQRGWFFMRLLDRNDKRFGMNRRGHLGGSEQTKLMFAKAGLLNKRIPKLNRQGQDRCRWMDYLRSEKKNEMMNSNDMLRSAVTIPVLKLPQLDTLPVLDGKLDDAVWAKANQITPFHFIKAAADAAKKPMQATEVKFYRTGDSMVIGMKCYESNMSDAGAFTNIKEHDGIVWGDDCVEIRLAPGVERNAMR